MCLNETWSDARAPSLFVCSVFNEVRAVNPSRRWGRQWYPNSSVAQLHTQVPLRRCIQTSGRLTSFLKRIYSSLSQENSIDVSPFICVGNIKRWIVVMCKTNDLTARGRRQNSVVCVRVRACVCVKLPPLLTHHKNTLTHACELTHLSH